MLEKEKKRDNMKSTSTKGQKKKKRKNERERWRCLTLEKRVKYVTQSTTVLSPVFSLQIADKIFWCTKRKKYLGPFKIRPTFHSNQTI